MVRFWQLRTINPPFSVQIHRSPSIQFQWFSLGSYLDCMKQRCPNHKNLEERFPSDLLPEQFGSKWRQSKQLYPTTSLWWVLVYEGSTLVYIPQTTQVNHRVLKEYFSLLFFMRFPNSLNLNLSSWSVIFIDRSRCTTYPLSSDRVHSKIQI